MDYWFGGLTVTLSLHDCGCYTAGQVKNNFVGTPKEVVLSKCLNKGDRYSLIIELETPKGLKSKIAMIGTKHQKQECIMHPGGVPLVTDGTDRVTKWMG